MDRGKDGAETGVDKQAENEAGTPGRFAHAGPDPAPRERTQWRMVPTFYWGAEARKVGKGCYCKPRLPGAGPRPKLGGVVPCPGARRGRSSEDEGRGLARVGVACLGLGRGRARMRADPHPLATGRELRAERKGAVSDFWDGDTVRPRRTGTESQRVGPSLRVLALSTSPRREGEARS